MGAKRAVRRPIEQGSFRVKSGSNSVTFRNSGDINVSANSAFYVVINGNNSALTIAQSSIGGVLAGLTKTASTNANSVSGTSASITFKWIDAGSAAAYNRTTTFSWKETDLDSGEMARKSRDLYTSGGTISISNTAGANIELSEFSVTMSPVVIPTPTGPSIEADPSKIYWGSTQTDIDLTVSNAVRVVAQWDSSTTVGIGVPSMYVAGGALVQGGVTGYLHPGETLIPATGSEFSNTQISLQADSSYPWEHSTGPGQFVGDITFTAYDANGMAASVIIRCQS